MPTRCPLYYDPVCGCDGKTYDNACSAAMRGMSVARKGACEPLPAVCNDNEDCSLNHYCLKSVGECEGDGNCKRKPHVCIEIYDPVCGCDGKTYPNECFAAVAGVSVSHEEECEPPPSTCKDNADCGSDYYYCGKGVGDCKEEGICEIKPRICPLYYDPVCGCDGRTYSNDCSAAMRGVSIAHKGVCKILIPIPHKSR